ncbi:MAG TPA: IclR family transcriptional regulator [Bryobacteraceae bacterium]|nr:IclR family transcriptional regulator [Bryobacteraceae bacterium]HPT25759.1 IclR family transcriptional regulator [Bryobacteraceae bacterium]
MKHSSIEPPPEPVALVESRSLAKGIQMLEYLADSATPGSLKSLSEQVELGKASALRLIKTLNAMGYLERDENDNYSLARDWPRPREQNRLRTLRESAMPYLESLGSELGETVAMAFLFDDVIRVIEVIDGTHHIRMSNYKGGILQPYASSLGKSIAAYQAPALMQRLLYTYGIFKMTPNTITDFRDIQDEFAAIRQRGYAWDREETVPGGTCIGAPIICAGGEVFSSVSMSMPKARFTKQVEEMLPALIKDHAARIAAELSKAGLGL